MHARKGDRAMSYLANSWRQREPRCDDARQMLVEDESAWRSHPRTMCVEEHSTLEIGRWTKWYPGTHELQAPILENHYTIDVLLSESYVDCFRDNQHVASRRAGYGATQVAAPGESIRCRFDRAAEAVHIYIASSAWRAIYEDLQASCTNPQLEFSDRCFVTDAAMGKLAEAIAVARSIDESIRDCYLESLIVAVLARLISGRKCAEEKKSIEPGLVRWRLRRAIDFIEANLNEPITLTDMAKHAGLSRMHFAAQFRLSTGLAPHIFLTSRRMERAKNMLRDSHLEIVDIAATVGIQSQAYFTTVFRKYTGTTPSRWRRDARAVDR